MSHEKGSSLRAWRLRFDGSREGTFTNSSTANGSSIFASGMQINIEKVDKQQSNFTADTNGFIVWVAPLNGEWRKIS